MKKLISLLFVVMVTIVGGSSVQAATISSINSNIVAAYTYDASTCVTGEESTCVKTDCYTSESETSCPAGTIIQYKVNDTTTKYFSILEDNGKKIVMQDRDNTVKSEWGDSNTSGPTTALAALETETSGWTNVNDQTYTMGTTTFKTNSFTGCSSYNQCETNTYTLSSRTAKARMITVQELSALGCTNTSCPSWLVNAKDQFDGFMTASANSTYNSYCMCTEYYYVIDQTPNGTGDSLISTWHQNKEYVKYVRAVVEVNKYISKEVDDNADVEISSNTSKVYIGGKASELARYKRVEVNEYSTDSDTYKKLQNIFTNKKSIFAYDFKLYDQDNNIIEPNSKIKVNIKLSSDINQDRVKVWYITDDYTKQELSYSIINNILTFETDHFSTYVLTVDNDDQVVKVEDTAFNVSNIGLIVGALIIIIGMIIFVKFYSNKNKRNQ